MPSNAIKSFAEKSGKSKGEVERLYQKSKDIVRKEYPRTPEDSEEFYQLVIGILKKIIKLQDEDMTTTSVGVNPGGDGAHQVRMFSLTPDEIEREKKKNARVLDYIKNYK